MNTQMQFFDELNACSTLSEQLHLVRTTEYDLYTEISQPSTLCERFIIFSSEDAMKAAEVMIHRFGNIIIDEDTSARYRKTVTIVDTLSCLCDIVDDPSSSWVRFKSYNGAWIPARDYIGSYHYWCKYLHDAFVAFGMKRYSEYPKEMIFYKHNISPQRKRYYCTSAVRMELDLIAKHKTDLKRDLIEYLHHPRFISKWIDSGDNDLLEYLQ